ncbi:MAG: hypothetical protein Q8N81_07885 [bacterium]|nr:hypothetical protein [bacterium]
MKTNITFFAAIFLLTSGVWPLSSRAEPSASDLQNISLGTSLTVDCLSKKPTKPGYMSCYPTLDISVKVGNNSAEPVFL